MPSVRRTQWLASNERHRIYEIDGLRAIAILLVVLYHFFQRFEDATPFGQTLLPWAKNGFFGVHLFFMISGFVIAFSLERTLGTKGGAWRFIRHRFFRLWPPLLACALLTFAFMHLIQTPFSEARAVGISGFIPTLTFVHPDIWRLVLPVDGYVDGVYWSLFVEVRFYVIALLLTLAFGLHRLGWVLLAASMTTSLLSLVSPTQMTPAAALVLETLFLMSFLPLFAAGVLAYRYVTKPSRAPVIGFTLSWATMMLPLTTWSERLWISGIFLLFLVLMMRLPWLAPLRLRPLVFIGTISYSLYLLHQNIGVGLLSLLPDGLPAGAYVAFSLTVFIALITAAYCVFTMVERPAQALARRFDKAQDHAHT